MSDPGTVLGVMRRLLVRCRPLLAGQRGGIALAAGALWLHLGLRVLEPWPLKFIVDALSGETPLLDGLQPTAIACAVAIPMITGVRAFAAYTQTIGFSLVGNRVLTDVRADLYDQLQRLTSSFHARARAGDLIVRVIGDVGLLKDVAVTALLPLVANVLVLIVMFSVMLWMSPVLTLAASVAVPAVVLLSKRLTPRIHTAARLQRRREAALATTAAESLGSIGVVQSLDLAEHFARVFRGQNEKGFRDGIQTRRLTARLERSVDVATAAGTGMVVGLGALLVSAGTLTLGDLIVFLTYLRRGFKPVQDFAKYTGRISRASAAADRVLEVLEQEPDVVDTPGAPAAPRFEGRLSFERVFFGYDPGVPVLCEVDFEIPPGTTVAIVGSAGAGKSTLGQLLLRLRDPDRGRICFDGTDVRTYTRSSVRRQIAIVLQDTTMFAGTVLSNLAFGRDDASRNEIERTMRHIGIHGWIERLPRGYETEVGERGVTLSPGQRQLITIGRAAMRDARLLLLDEPTAALDSASTRRIDAALVRLSEGRTTLWITHDPARARAADRVLIIEAGRIVAFETPAALLCDGRYAHWIREAEAPRANAG